MDFRCKCFIIIIVNLYVLTEDKSEKVKNAFYDKWDRVCDRLR